MVTHWKIINTHEMHTKPELCKSVNFSSLFHSSSSLGAWSFTVHFLNYYYLPDAKPKLGYEILPKGQGKSSEHLERLILYIKATCVSVRPSVCGDKNKTRSWNERGPQNLRGPEPRCLSVCHDKQRRAGAGQDRAGAGQDRAGAGQDSPESFFFFFFVLTKTTFFFF